MNRTPLVRTVTAAGVLAVVILAQVGLVLAPSLLERNPLLVLALRPTPAFLVLLGDAVGPVTAIVVAAVGRTLVDLAYFAVARHGTLPILERVGVGRGVSRGLSRPTAARGLLAITFFWSSTPIIAALGLGTTPAWVFLAATGFGNVATSGVYVFFGHQLSDVLAPVTAWMSAHGAALTVGLIATMAVGVTATWKRGARLAVAGSGSDTDSTPIGVRGEDDPWRSGCSGRLSSSATDGSWK